MTREAPRFLDQQSHAEPTPPTGTPSVTAEPAATIETPRLLDAAPDAPAAITADWNPSRLASGRAPRGSFALAAAGAAVVLVSWLLLSALASIIGFFNTSTALGGVASALYLGGFGLVLYAAAREWRSLRDLHQVDALRIALANPAGDIEATRRLCSGWLNRLSTTLPEATALAPALTEAADIPQMRAMIRSRLTGPLDAATKRIGIKAASEVGALVALSPHASWDGVITGWRGLRVIRQVAEVHALRPGPAVTVALLGRVSRAAVETASTDLLSQTAADHFLANVPVIKHLVAAIPGASVAAFRLYRLAVIAGRVCFPAAL